MFYSFEVVRSTPCQEPDAYYLAVLEHQASFALNHERQGQSTIWALCEYLDFADSMPQPVRKEVYSRCVDALFSYISENFQSAFVAALVEKSWAAQTMRELVADQMAAAFRASRSLSARVS